MTIQSLWDCSCLSCWLGAPGQILAESCPRLHTILLSMATRNEHREEGNGEKTSSCKI